MIYYLTMFLFISSHIGALLFKIEAAVRFGYKQVTCTDKPYTWNNDFAQKIEGEFVKDIKGEPFEPYQTFKEGSLYQQLIDIIRKNGNAIDVTSLL